MKRTLNAVFVLLTVVLLVEAGVLAGERVHQQRRSLREHKKYHCVVGDLGKVGKNMAINPQKAFATVSGPRGREVLEKCRDAFYPQWNKWVSPANNKDAVHVTLTAVREHDNKVSAKKTYRLTQYMCGHVPQAKKVRGRLTQDQMSELKRLNDGVFLAQKPAEAYDQCACKLMRGKAVAGKSKHDVMKDRMIVDIGDRMRVR